MQSPNLDNTLNRPSITSLAPTPTPTHKKTHHLKPVSIDLSQPGFKIQMASPHPPTPGQTPKGRNSVFEFAGDYNSAHLPRTLAVLGSGELDENNTSRNRTESFAQEYHKRSKKKFPIFIATCILVNIIFFVYCMYLNEWKFDGSNPLYGPSTANLIAAGAKDVNSILGGQWWRFFIPMFLHAGIIHLFFNMAMLYQVGSDMEGNFGILKTLVIYIVSGVSGTLCSCLFLPNMVGVGASGALYGLLGAGMADWLHNGHTFINRYSYCGCLIMNISVGVAMGLLPLVDNFAHIGGIVCGFFIGCIIMHSSLSGTKDSYNYTIMVMGAIGLVAWFGIGFFYFYSRRSAYEWCGYCKYLSCLNTPYWTCPTTTA